MTGQNAYGKKDNFACCHGEGGKGKRVDPFTDLLSDQQISSVEKACSDGHKISGVEAKLAPYVPADNKGHSRKGDE